MELICQYASIRELEIYFNWANDELVREHSFNSEPIPFNQHQKWFKSKLNDKNCFLYYFTIQNEPAGQVRIDIGQEETVIGISVDKKFRGKSISSKMLIEATNRFKREYPHIIISAYIKSNNKASYKTFLKAGFKEEKSLEVKGFESYKLIVT